MVEAKIPLAARKSIRDSFEPFVAKFTEDYTKLLGEPYTMDIPWAELMASCGAERSRMLEDPGAAVAAYFEDVLWQLKSITKERSDDMIKEGFAEACPTKIMSIKTEDKVSGLSSCAFEDGKFFIVFQKGDDFGKNQHKTLESLESKL